MTTAIIILIVAILLVLLINESGLDAASARVFRLLIIGVALVFVVVKLLPLA